MIITELDAAIRNIESESRDEIIVVSETWETQPEPEKREPEWVAAVCVVAIFSIPALFAFFGGGRL